VFAGDAKHAKAAVARIVALVTRYAAAEADVEPDT
jgi:hypothetical protein